MSPAVKTAIEFTDLISLKENDFKNKRYVIQNSLLINNELGQFALFDLGGKFFSILSCNGTCQYLLLDKVDFPIMNRRGAIENQFYWLFQQPDEDYQFNELKITETITDDDTGNEYAKELSVLGEVTEIPAPDGLSNLFGGLCQYYCKGAAQEFILLLEKGEINNEDGGVFSFYKGREIKEHEIVY